MTRHSSSCGFAASIAALFLLFGGTGTASAERGAVPALESPLAVRATLNRLAAAGEHAIAVGDYGMIVRVAPDGAWEQSPSPVDVMLTDVFFLDERTGWAVGYDGAVIQTSDGGQSWELLRWEPDGDTLYDVKFFSERRGIAVGGYGLYLVTDDGGRTWTEERPAMSELGQHIYELLPLPDGTLFAVGERGLLAFSTDDAANWELVDSPYTGSLFGALPYGESGAVIFGLRGNIFVTDDVKALPTMDWLDWDLFERESVREPDALAELGWRFIESPVNESFFGGTRESDSTMLVVGVNGHVVRIDATAGTAEKLSVPDFGNLGDILIDATGWLVAGRGGLRRLSATGDRR